MLREAEDFLHKAGKVTLVLVSINVLVFIIFTLIGDTESGRFMLYHGAAYTPLVLEGQYYRLFTSMFLHFGLTHLVYNMICLLSLGNMLEKEIGSPLFLIIYLLGGVAGNLLSMFWEMRIGQYSISAGASGAIFAVIGAMLSIVIRRKGTGNRSMAQRLILMTVLMIGQGFIEAGTDNAAHIGGFLTGLLLGFLLCRNREGDRGEENLDERMWKS